ncbi:hypothetical protein bcere0026_53200 [Bacillus mycoides]|uniref:Uncharacterized protein n=1 Tax=Bacillus mycoides TaxID=1405 RepID=C2Y2X3_BACMY|nr:hypothetical protein bcere0026_53200 [Bacillus mycoides]
MFLSSEYGNFIIGKFSNSYCRHNVNAGGNTFGLRDGDFLRILVHCIEY